MMDWAHCSDPSGPSAGDTAWMLFATTFVMLQTPATGICQAGLVRRKNCVSVLAQTMLGVAIGAVLWLLFGFSLTFGTSHNGMIGDFDNSLLFGIHARDCHPNAPTIPAIIFVSYQMMFALMCPVLVTGAWAERMHFKSFVVFTVLWPILVYYPVAHWFWNKQGFLQVWGVLDFAGGLVIHATSGVAALVVSVMLEKRRNHLVLAHKGTVHNIPLMVIGGALIWAGWYSFNGGSAMAANFQAVNALMATQMSASVGAIVWSALSAITTGKVPCAAIVSGALSGLAGITAASGFVTPPVAAIAGLLAGVSSFFAARVIRTTLLIDDVLDVTALQAVPGISGAIVVAFAADPELIPGVVRTSRHEGLFVGGKAILLGKQLTAIVVTCAWTAVMTWLLFMAMDRTIGINITPEDEDKGLDEVDHGERAYDDDYGVGNELEHATGTLGAKMCDAAASGDVVEIARLLRAGASLVATDYEGRTPMHSAAASGQVHVMGWLHQVHGVAVDVRDAWGGVPMQDAMKANQGGAITWLLTHGATVDENDVAEMMCSAAASNDAARLRLLLGSVVGNASVQDYDQRTPLHIAASHGFRECVQVLLSFGAHVDAKDRFGFTPIDDAKRGRFKDVELLLRAAKDEPVSVENNRFLPQNHSSAEFSLRSNNTDNTNSINANRVTTDDTISNPSSPLIGPSMAPLKRPDSRMALLARTTSKSKVSTATSELCSAAACGDLQEVRRLIRKGADPNLGDYNNRTALHVASANGHVDVVTYLCGLRGININCQDRFQSTPLMDATTREHTNVSQILRQHGATIVDKTHGYRLCRAAAEGNIQMLEQLARHGANLSSTDYDGRTALHLAACSNNLKVVQWLIGWGVELSVTDRWGSSPLNDAVRLGHSEIAGILRGAGAKEFANDALVNAAEEQAGL